MRYFPHDVLCALTGCLERRAEFVFGAAPLCRQHLNAVQLDLLDEWVDRMTEAGALAFTLVRSVESEPCRT